MGGWRGELACPQPFALTTGLHYHIPPLVGEREGTLSTGEQQFSPGGRPRELVLHRLRLGWWGRR